MVTQPHQHQAVALQQRFGCRYRIGKEWLIVRIPSGAVHQHADLDVCGGVDNGLRGIGVSEIDGERPSFDTGAPVNRLGHRVEKLPATSDERDVHALLRQPLGEQRAASVGRADDQPPRPVFPGDVTHERPPLG